MDTEPFQTAESHDLPTVRQQSVFIDNHVGQLMRLTRIFDRADTRMLAFSIVNATDCAICRLILDDPDVGYDALTHARFVVSETELLVVSLPPGKHALLQCWAALLNGEINIHYAYPLISRPNDLAAIVIYPDNIEQAVTVLRERRFTVLDQGDLRGDRGS